MNNKHDIAVIGMAGKFPGAKDIDQFWKNITEGVESVKFFTDEELTQAGIPPELLKNINYIKAKGYLEDASLFDANFFDFNKRDAELLDPQFRLFLETAWAALENAAYIPDDPNIKIGVFAGSSTLNSYYLNNLVKNINTLSLIDEFTLLAYNAKDFLASLLAYKLNLTGPCVNVQTACSTSLVAICMACESLISAKCDIALAGGVSITTPLKSGYLYQVGMILSSDGHCRPFDAAASGTVVGNGAGILVLKPLDKALADKDYIHAIIKGFAVNNDGQNKIGFIAPSIEGQRQVIQSAITMAGITPDMISYLETHGTATPVGDSIELTALVEAFSNSSNDIPSNSIVLGTTKPNIGHLDVAAGVASVIKTIEALKNKTFPPSINYLSPNTEIDFTALPFYINSTNSDWPEKNYPRYAGVSSFGMGGTNAHIILQEANYTLPYKNTNFPVLLILSAKTISALIRRRRNLSQYLKIHSETDLANLAFTLQVGRKKMKYRFACICFSIEEAIEKLNLLDAQEILEIDENLSNSFDKSMLAKIYSTAKHWLADKTIDWSNIYPNFNLYRIPLPSYPFERREYWITPKNINPPGYENESTSNNILSPDNKSILKIPIETIEYEISNIFKSFFGTDKIQSCDDLYNFGGDSLLLLQIIAEINKKLGLIISVDTLEKYSSAKSLAQFINGNQEQN